MPFTEEPGQLTTNRALEYVKDSVDAVKTALETNKTYSATMLNVVTSATASDSQEIKTYSAVRIQIDSVGTGVSGGFCEIKVYGQLAGMEWVELAAFAASLGAGVKQTDSWDMQANRVYENIKVETSNYTDDIQTTAKILCRV